MLSSKEKMTAYRKRMKSLDLIELRGLWVPSSTIDTLKPIIKKMITTATIKHNQEKLT